jgi:hypothetical protein
MGRALEGDAKQPWHMSWSKRAKTTQAHADQSESIDPTCFERSREQSPPAGTPELSREAHVYDVSFTDDCGVTSETIELRFDLYY